MGKTKTALLALTSRGTFDSRNVKAQDNFSHLGINITSILSKSSSLDLVLRSSNA